ncbi:MAG: zinc ribbon domain-containing protein [Anaerolineae bacterium]
MSRTQMLYDLQQTDWELEEIAQQLEQIAVKLSEDSALQRAQQRAAEAEAKLHVCHAQTQDLDLEVRSLTQRIEADEQRLYSGRVTNPKELTSLQNDVAALKRWREKKEESLLEAMEAEEEAEAQLAEARDLLTRITEEWQSMQARLLTEKEHLEGRRHELEEYRRFLLSTLADADLEVYERLRTRKGGRAVAGVKNGVCQGCHVAPPLHQIQRASLGSELIFCNNCGRILHVL